MTLHGHTPFPYEEGTETLEFREIRRVRPGHTPFPYEEGTETHKSAEGVGGKKSHTPFPYEEGTETTLITAGSPFSSHVTHPFPMKRELKLCGCQTG